MTLDETLDRVPIEKLEAAVRRRRAQGKLAPFLEKIEAETGITADVILGDSRARPDVAARHALYSALWQAGYDVTRIGELTRHDRHRITSALVKFSAR